MWFTDENCYRNAAYSSNADFIAVGIKAYAFSNIHSTEGEHRFAALVATQTCIRTH